MKIHGIEIDRFTLSYIETAMRLSTDDSGAPLDDDFLLRDLTVETVKSMKEDCQTFQETMKEDILPYDLTQAGQDFWLTRNRHGAGFWDGDYPNDVGQRLTDASHAFGEQTLIVGTDGNIHIA